MPGHPFALTGVDIAAAKEADYLQNTISELEPLGCMKEFVSKQSRVGLLINSAQNDPGSYVKAAQKAFQIIFWKNRAIVVGKDLLPGLYGAGNSFFHLIGAPGMS